MRNNRAYHTVKDGISAVVKDRPAPEEPVTARQDPEKYIAQQMRLTGWSRAEIIRRTWGQSKNRPPEKPPTESKPVKKSAPAPKAKGPTPSEVMSDKEDDHTRRAAARGLALSRAYVRK